MPLRNVFLSGQLSGIPEGKTATLKVEGQHDSITVSLTGLKAKETAPADSVASVIEEKRKTIIGRIEDVHSKIEAYRRIYEIAFTEHFSMANEAARLEKELLDAGIPQSEIESVRDEVVMEIDRRENERRAAEEILGTENVPYESPAPDVAKLFYPISPEAVATVINFFIVHAEKPLKLPQFAQLRNDLIVKGIYDACELLL